ncbi:hypothetical protein C0989_010376 [Termitomyces sp. Mn162]|nr:hypothetical protein C0989_010376 [Termitomyces sp. Mn162]
MSSEATVSVAEFAALCESHSQLHSMMSELLTTISSMLNTSPLVAVSQQAMTTVSPQTIGTFIPPIQRAEINGMSAVLLTLCTQFPDVNAAVITAIIMHKFRAVDLHKLDPMNWDKETAYMFNGTTNQFKVSNSTAKEYKSPFTILIPLQTYFDILSFHVNSATAMGAFYRYMAHLLKLIAEYEWSAVYDYHTIFFNWHRAKMASGDYS